MVVNKWASWCGPCRLEFPFFRSQAEKRKGEIVFIGVNSNDNRGDAEEFLDEQPVPFKHFEDPQLEIAASFDAVQAFPATAYYDKDGELAYVHAGRLLRRGDPGEGHRALRPLTWRCARHATTTRSPPRSSSASGSSAASRACRSRPTRTVATPRPRTSWRWTAEP